MAPKMKNENSNRIRRCNRLPSQNKNECERKSSENCQMPKTITSKAENLTSNGKENNDLLNKSYPVKWDVSTDVIADILQDMGVGILDDISCDIPDFEPTPPMTTNSTIPTNSLTPKPYSYPPSENTSPDIRRIDNDFILFKRTKPNGILGENYFTKLSDEIILHIFKWLSKSMLSRCASVCKRWKTLCYDESLWRRLDLGRKHLEPGVLGRVIDRGVIVLRLAMAEILTPIFIDSSAIMKNKERYSKLQYLDLSMTSINQQGLQELFSVCSQLKKISLEHCQVNTEICFHIAENEDLEVLNMTMCEGITNEGINRLVQRCQKLESLNLSWTNMTSECIYSIVKNISSSLKHFNLSGCRHTLTDEHVSILVEKCPDLIDLDLSDATLLTGLSVDAIINNLSNLQHLHLNRCYNIPSISYLSLSSIPSLQQFDCFGILTETALHTLRSNLPGIEINRHLFSVIARPTTGIRRTSIWHLRVRD